MPRRRSSRTRAAIDVIVAGNIYCDFVFSGLAAAPVLGEEQRTDRFELTVGGGAFITAAGLVRLGLRAAARAYVGRDVLGDVQLAALWRENVDLSQIVLHPALGAGVTVAFSTRTDRGFLTYPGCADDTGRRLTARALPELRRARHVHFSGMPRPFGERLRLLEGLAAARVTTSLDIGWNPHRYRGAAFREIIRRVTIFLPSWRDARWLTGRATPVDAVKTLGDLVPVPVIKLGARGAIGLDGGRPIRVRPPAVTAVDTTGAGDAFDAGFLWAYLRGDPISRCLLAGNVCGALSTRAAGGVAAFPTFRELTQHLRRRRSREPRR
jgi:sugar/nucleoside kinase (ribokinase family)